MRKIYLYITLLLPFWVYAQNVGVGTVSPFYKLDVDGTLGVPRSHRLQFYEPGTGNARAFIGSSNVAPFNELIFGVGASVEAMRIIPNGNLGIGVTDPSARLHVSGSVRFQTIINGYLKADANGNISSVATIPSADVTGLDNSKWTQVGNNLYPNNLSWNLGIGTNAPNHPLVVSGSSTTSPVVIKVQNLGGTNSAGTKLILGNSNGIANDHSSAELFAIRTNIGGAGSTDLAISTSLATTVTERMRILANGNIGIGTSVPGSKLHVNGNISVHGTIPANVWGGTANIGIGSSGIGGTTQGIIGHQGSHNLDIFWNFHRVDGGNVYTGLSANGSSAANGISLGSTGIIFRTIATMGTTIPTERMRISSNGNIGIGTTNPQTLFHVAGNSSTALMRLQSTGSGTQEITQNMPGLELIANGMNATSKYTPAIKFSSTDPELTTHNPKYLAGIVGRATQTYNTDQTGGMSIDFLTSPNTPGASSTPQVRMSIASNGNVGIGIESPTYHLHVSGRIKSDGILESSDVRLKKDISKLKDALQKVMQLQGVSYAWKTQEELDAEKINYTVTESGKEEIGLLAQEVEKILPQLVNTDNDGFKSIEYSKLVALLIEAIKEQQSQMNTLKAENVQFKNYVEKTDKLEAELSDIKSFIFQQSQR